ncbi:MAG: XdhC family protein, partial [Trueperaceae bacterium]|nr:XdhC family protein [Trueperaceae bacterium]
MDWITQAARLAEAQQNFVMVTLVSVRGHAPRGAGTKMIVTEDERS